MKLPFSSFNLIFFTIKVPRTKEIVESYLATKDRYINVTEFLENHFGRTDMLIEVYIRGVLASMMNDALGKGTVGSKIIRVLEIIRIKKLTSKAVL